MAAPVRIAAMVESIVGCKWSLRLLALLAAGPQRPSAMQRACPGLSAKVLNERLRKFQRFGLVVRRVAGERPPIEVDYSLSPLGRRFLGLLAEVDRLQQALDQGDVPSA
ncbi:MAG: helix-turn-helix transcriptional regulator [Planctomycetes bacterium]|nr:helix-turn-helix transcriptional regulator [Planctomycetota bacterium]